MANIAESAAIYAGAVPAVAAYYNGVRVWPPPGVDAHDQLTGLADNDHPQYMTASGGALSGPLYLAYTAANPLEAVRKDYFSAIEDAIEDAPVMFVQSAKPTTASKGDIWVPV